MLEGSYCINGYLSKFFYLNSTTDIGVIELNENIHRCNILNSGAVRDGIKSFIEENPAGKYFIDLRNIQFVDSHAFGDLLGMQEKAETDGKRVNLVVSPQVDEIMVRCDYKPIFSSYLGIPGDVQSELDQLKLSLGD